MNAVATITPEPKYLEIKRIHEGIPAPSRLAANTGNHVPKKEPIRITKTAEMRTPVRPSKSLSVGHSDIFGARSETGKECSKLVKTRFQGLLLKLSVVDTKSTLKNKSGIVLQRNAVVPWLNFFGERTAQAPGLVLIDHVMKG
jgi:hypothetical protein